jgi:CheY-like chemotaxis protein
MFPNKVLIIDDEPLILKSTALLLKKVDIDSIVAQNGAEGLLLAATNRPDLIFLDLKMPILDGLEVLSRLKADKDLTHIPVVVFTADDFELSDVERLGVAGICRKPFHPQDFLHVVSRFITESAARKDF